MNNFDLKKYLTEGKLLKEGTGVDMILSPDQIKRYARMKTVGNISDPKLISKVIEIISDILPQNPNISKEELANQFGEDVVQRTTQILFSAYIDGYSDKAGNLPLVKDYISIFTQMADDERDEELAEGSDDDDSITYLMSQDEEIELRIKEIINYLNEIEIDGETMQHIIDSVGMDEQMLHQLTPGGIREAITPESMVTIEDMNNFLVQGDYDELDGYGDEEFKIIKKHIKLDILDKGKKLTPSKLNSLIVRLEDKYDWY
jgi:coenzyme F420-reducing hydrogenase alpha subunit